MPSPTEKSTTNTVLITDQKLIHKDNGYLLDQLIDSIKEIVHKKQEKITITKLPFFQRCVLVFQNKKTAEEVFTSLNSNQVKCSFAPRDTKFEFSNFINNGNNSNTDSIDSEITRESTQSDTLLNSESGLFDKEESPFLQVPERHIELQSPPASPYLGFVPHQPEEPPDAVTITDPESLSHILYQKTIDDLDKEKVFQTEQQSDYIDIDVPIFVLNRSAAEDLKKESSSRHKN